MVSGEAGHRKLLELGIRAKLKRPLHWRENACVCYCIMSPLTGISGKRARDLLNISMHYHVIQFA